MSKMEQIWRGLRGDTLLGLALGFMLGVALFALLIDHPPASDAITAMTINCEEDAVWMFVDKDSPGAVVDVRGVTRLCISHDLLVSDAIAYAIQEGVLMYVPSP